MTGTVAHGTNAVGLSDCNVMIRGVLLDVGKQFDDGCVGRVVDLRVLEDSCAQLRYIIEFREGFGESALRQLHGSYLHPHREEQYGRRGAGACSRKQWCR
jgi:hypothetical protein